MKRELDSENKCDSNQENDANGAPVNKIAKPTHANGQFEFSSSPGLENIRKSMEKFVGERNWEQFHTPRNILLAMVGEVGELAELFQWRGEVKKGLPDWTEKDKEHLGQELSDVLLYLIRLADRCEIDLPSAVVRKMEHNRKKYPVDKVFGSSKKYTEYKEKFKEGGADCNAETDTNDAKGEGE